MHDLMRYEEMNELVTFDELHTTFIQECNLPKQYHLTIELGLKRTWDKLRTKRGLPPIYSKPTLLDTSEPEVPVVTKEVPEFTIDSW
jgi:hypothetical protein